MSENKYIFAHKDIDVALISIILNQNGFSHKIVSAYLGLPLFKDDFFIFKEGYIDWYCAVGMWNKVVKAIFVKIKKERNFSRKIVGKSYEIGKKLKYSCYEALRNRYALLSYKEWHKIISLYDQLLGLGVVAPLSDIQHFRLTRMTEEIIENKIKLNNLSGQVGDYLAVLNKHTKELETAKFEKTLLVLAGKFSKVKELKIRNTEIQRCLDKYKWVYFGHIGPEMTYTDLTERIKELLMSKKALQDLKNKFISFKKLRYLQKKYEKELRLNLEEKRIFRVARDFNENKAYRLELMFLIHYTLHQALKLIASKYRRSVKELLCLTHLEFLDLLKKGSMVSRSILRKRNKFCVCYTPVYNKINIYTGKKAEMFVKKFVPNEEIKKEKIIKGSTASLGKAKGAVKIVNSVKDIGKVKKGDILVAPQTTPQLLPAMKNAAAFVTDIGGITSHAAIVAREWKVPCIIGTWIATKVLKDGDLVEVDATHGIVRII